MGCLYSEGELSKCQCKCGGAKHGLLVPEVHIVAALCTPGHEKQCKSGAEGVECSCQCNGINHALFHGIEGFENVRITGYQEYND